MPAYYLLILLLTLAFDARGESGQAAPAFDSVAAHHIYLEGEFGQAIQMLEPMLKRKNLNHGDSVFIFKHLGVMFAANENTREKGKYYMYKLIEAEPLSNILDMYASDMIYMIFKNVKDEFEASQIRMERAQRYLGKDGKGVAKTKADTLGHLKTGPKPTDESVAKKPGSSGHQAYYWFGGVGVAAAVGVGVLVYMQGEEEPKVTKKIYGLE